MLLLTATTALTLATSISAAVIEPRWFNCEREPYAPPPNVGLTLNVLTGQGTNSPWISQNSSYCRNVPDGWIVDQVNIIHRHGARSPTVNGLTGINATLAKLKGIPPTDSKLDFVKTYSTAGFIPEELTDYGRKQLYDSGAAYAKRYPEQIKDLFTRSSGSGRVVESGQYWLLGASGQAFKVQNQTALPKINVNMTYADGANNTLHVSTCENDEDTGGSDDYVKAATTKWRQTYAEPIAKRLNALLPGANLTANGDVQVLFSMCGYDSVRNLDYQKGPWCDVFTQDEWKQYAYDFDLQKWYGFGPGNPYSAAEHSGYVAEILARLTDSKPVATGGNNATLLQEQYFPLKKKFYADFTHDNDITMKLSAFGLGQEPNLPVNPSSSQVPAHNFRVGTQTPFGARVTIERIQSTDGPKYVRILINDAVQPLLWPGCGLFGYKGLCELNAFVAAHARVNDPTYFADYCFGQKRNITYG